MNAVSPDIASAYNFGILQRERSDIVHRQPNHLLKSVAGRTVAVAFLGPTVAVCLAIADEQISIESCPHLGSPIPWIGTKPREPFRMRTSRTSCIRSPA